MNGARVLVEFLGGPKHGRLEFWLLPIDDIAIFDERGRLWRYRTEMVDEGRVIAWGDRPSTAARTRTEL